jgi:type I restriction enzyme S subunit
MNSILNFKLPTDWHESILDNLIAPGSKITYGVVQPGDEVVDGVPFVRGGDIFGGRISIEKLRTISKEISATYSRTLLKGGELLMSLVGYPGEVAIVPPILAGANIARQVAFIKLGKLVACRYVMYYLQSDLGRYFLFQKSTGSAQQVINLIDLKEVNILIPTFPEQQKIAAILTAVDDVIVSTQAKINKLKDLKTSMMQELLTKGIGHTEFKDSPVGQIPKTWELKPLDTIVGKIVDCEHKTAPYVEKSDYIVVRTNNVKNGQLIFDDIRFTNEESYTEWTSRLIPIEGDVLFTREAPAGESCMVPKNIKICMGQRMVLLRPNRSHIDGEYFSIYLNSQIAINSIFRFSIGTTVSRINIEDIRRIPCIVPPLDEQNKIAGCINSIQNSIRALEDKLQSNLSEKKALMQDLLSGKIRVKVDNS